MIAKAIRATTALTEIGLLQKTSLVEFICECVSYLNHPNLWIRHEICGLISTAAKVLSALDVQCKIMPAVTPHLRCPLIQVEKIELLLDCLQPPIPRNVYDTVIKFPEIVQFMDTLKARKIARSRAGADGIPKYGETTQAIRNVRIFLQRYLELIVFFTVIPTFIGK